MSEKLLTIQDLGIGYWSEALLKPVLEGINITISPGEIVGLAGPSGVGKTTLALSLLGLLPPIAEILSGTIFFQHMSLHDADERAFQSIRGKEIGAVFQEPSAVLDPVMRIDKQLCEGMKYHFRMGSEEALENAKELLLAVGIQDPEGCLISYPHQLSGGMQQRVLIASAISCKPKLLICDEPTSALDILTQNKVLDLLGDLQQEREFSILLISHDLSSIKRISDRIIFME